jgi:uncharacterized protein with ParB-like and HNH nuclease domain
MRSGKKVQIESDKVVIQEVFSRFWFRIPDYQRAYVWGKDEISELIDDVNHASEHNPDGQYFLGSMVLRARHKELLNKLASSYAAKP